MGYVRVEREWAAGVLLTVAVVGESVARAFLAPGTVGHNVLTTSVRQTERAGSHVPTLPVTTVTSPSSALVLWLLFLLGVLCTLPLVFLRPVGAAVLVAGASVVSLTLVHFVTVAGVIALMIALYRLGLAGSGFGAPVLGVPFLALALGDFGGTQVRVFAILLTALAPGAAFAGVALRERRAAVVRGALAEDFAGRLIEHTARGERARIVRELHDVVAHHVSLVAVQAESARLTTPGMPAAGAARLLDIGDTARAALTEMRRLLGVLREDAEVVVADRRPQPGLAQLNELLDESREASAGGVRLIVSGSVTPLDPGVELAAYRIVQEALTNARRHAPGAAVDVELRYSGEELWLRIRDNGPGSDGLAAGHGLLGMRERAVAVGGSLQAGTAASGGFLVEATLPGKAET
jgi:signal transduction histidine kinase